MLPCNTVELHAPPPDPFIGGSSDKMNEPKQISSLIFKNDFT